MPKYIDIESLRIVLPMMSDEYGDALISVRDLQEALRRVPPADVRENVRGEWRYYADENKNISVVCPVCGIGGKEATTFCPYCGAFLKRRTEEEKRRRG